VAQRTASRTPVLALILLLAAYLIVAGLYAIYTPAWQTPDEPAHYNYAGQIVNTGCCPTIQPGDWNKPYQEQLTGARFNPSLLGNLGTLQYEDHQPPLYYLLSALVYQWNNGSLTAIRLFSVLIGAGVVLCAYGAAAALLPDRPAIVLSTAALVAFLPQHVAMLASANNDGLAELIIALTLWSTILYLKGRPLKPLEWSLGAAGVAGMLILLYYRPESQPLAFLLLLVIVVVTLAGYFFFIQSRPFADVYGLGALVGLGLLTKVSALFLLGVVLVAVLLKWWSPPEAHSNLSLPNGAGGEVKPHTRRWAWSHLRPLVRTAATFLLPALLLGGFWWARDISVYGFPDVFGLRQHNLVVADQYRTAQYIRDYGTGQYIKDFARLTFQSFWGQFGWMAVPMPTWIYAAIGALLLIVLAGWVIDKTVLRRNAPPPAAPQRNAWLVLALTAVLAFLAYLYYNTEFFQPQGRYLFTGLVPFGLWMALGVDAWRRWLWRGSGEGRWAAYVTALPFLAFALVDVYMLWRFIVPGLKP
jgi:hypothetical protein